ncbi:hypothetical protein CHLRE_06g307750v5 [Chlamydomonas reinhardtii]|jgi:hypothetical protein|uniref:Uncharacterized protein n=1 Tax=Chlamydomonas reinhardtii TaxID=3055 RepID=A8IMR9_CHLRE|nr:uncharacterized protein CHLRE_06g307750v5 [Chlamydomonas reinhardtii]PNW83128.1 hypothetical protein CHLRE_06g307750v5 [Chlamydomonas reinhardtii]|eukprot:XP_001691367.1 predicted protein [Chlamydomonas reinhardtii]
MAPHREACIALVATLVLVAQAAGSTITVFGDRVKHPSASKEYVRTYVKVPKEHDSMTPVVTVGVELTLGFIRRAQDLPATVRMEIPLGPNMVFNYTGNEYNQMFPDVGNSPFTFLYWGFNWNGHPPPGIYDNPHFDFHFMMKPYDYWWNEYNPSAHGECGGLSNATFNKVFKPVPASCWPGDVQGPITNLGDAVWAMGSHLYDLSGEEFKQQKQFNFTQIYGQWDGSIAYLEPMVSQQMMLSRAVGYTFCRTLVHNPENMAEAQLLPRKLCFKKTSKAFYVEYKDFYSVEGGCVATNGVYAGTYPPSGPPIPATCTIPTAPSA